MLDDYTHTGAPTVPGLRPEFWRDHQRDIIDAPVFLPLGYHFNHWRDAGVHAAHAIRPCAFSSPND